MENLLSSANHKRRIGKVAIVILVFIYCFRWYSNCEKPAISMCQALMQRDNVNYFIVRRAGFWGEGELGYLDGTKLTPFFLAGRAPASELSWIISGQGTQNYFLVKGYIDFALSEIAGRNVIVAEDWDIIAPISRSYEMEDPERRIFPPRFYLDQYDVETGVYFQIVSELRAIQWFEEKEMINESESDCFVITSDIIDNEVQWYLVEENRKTPLHLTGCPLETHFNEKILSGCRNQFLVEGNLDENQRELFVENWYIEYPISRDGFVPHESHSYFIEQDVLNGIYIP